ncbi:putative phospholipase C20G8.02, mitochondrial [Wickerhamiella sorbophila]|uniref:Putative phospholipase C20G8.02, mitochondrial n=1 Tax=Wickerhamiella sorbophila TaxID=45607 RepID=A0A2T0FF37_9ASCO|nr:putative phospholipase C20G8.02, mitochondrial [Wickerhamiella sorbophila]PRT53613.1 putative phospholipase C20G8.02, mitochondrial [Wickerhamiella sorbophila]
MRGIRLFSGKTRWFRSTTAPVAKPAQFRYVPKEQPGGYEPFALEDSNRLENAFVLGSKECTIQTDGLFKVNIEDRHYTSTYWEGPTFKVLRGTWFHQGTSKLTPIAEGLAEELEENYQAGKTDFVLKQGQKINLKRTGDQITGTMSHDDSWANMIKSLQLPRNYSIVRGYRNEKAKEKSTASPTIGKKKMEDNMPHPGATGTTNRPIKHLILAIHGVGQQLGIRYEFVNFVKDTNEFRDLMKQIHAKDESLKLASASETNHGIQVLPILWRHLIPNQSKNLDPQLKGLTVSQLMAKDNLLADVALDYVMYTHKEYQDTMLSATASELNRVYKTFCENNPDFAENPKVSIAGHSLGSVIANNLLRSEYKLNFEVDNVFFLGSPVGCLQFLTGKPFTKEGCRVKNMYNIFRASDPIGSRIEPLVNKATVDVKPQSLPANGMITQIKDFTEDLTALGLSITKGATVLWNQIADTKATETPEQETKTQQVDPAMDERLKRDLAAFNRHHRLDFAIPESMDISLVLAIAGHTMYFDNYDLASFIMKEILDVPVAKEPMIREESNDEDLAAS